LLEGANRPDAFTFGVPELSLILLDHTTRPDIRSIDYNMDNLPKTVYSYLVPLSSLQGDAPWALSSRAKPMRKLLLTYKERPRSRSSSRCCRSSRTPPEHLTLPN